MNIIICVIIYYFFFNANKSNKINTPPKIIKDNKVLEIDELTLNKDANTDNTDNIMDESGYIFETLAYGRKRNLFNLKQLLFIGNEKNDNLNIYQYKEKFKNLKRDPKEENGVNIESLLHFSIIVPIESSITFPKFVK